MFFFRGFSIGANSVLLALQAFFCKFKVLGNNFKPYIFSFQNLSDNSNLSGAKKWIKHDIFFTACVGEYFPIISLGSLVGVFMSPLQYSRLMT